MHCKPLRKCTVEHIWKSHSVIGLISTSSARYHFGRCQYAFICEEAVYVQEFSMTKHGGKSKLHYYQALLPNL